MRYVGSIVTLFALSGAAFAQPTIDGNIQGDEGAYGPALAVQTIETGFGNAANGDPRFANGGSEIDALYGTVVDDRLYLLITGNLESNFNKMEIFFDTVDGGFNTLPTDSMTNPNSEFGNEYPEIDGFLNGSIDGFGSLQRMAGLTFDTGFDADYYLTFSNGTETASSGVQSWAITPHFTKIDKLVSAGGTVPDPPAGEGSGALGGTTDAQGIGQNSGGALEDAANNNGDPFDVFWSDRATANTADLRFSIDNSNTLGVGGSGGLPADQAAAAAVQTGAELSLPLAAIGSPETGRIRMSVFINGVGHDFLSNQVIGGLPETFGNLAEPASVDFSQDDGDQFVTMRVIGDMDVNGRVDFDDINPFVLGLNNPDQYLSSFGISPVANGDTDRNGIFDFDDIPGFVDLLSGGQLGSAAEAVPEPGAMALLIAAAVAGLVACRRR